MVELIRKMLSEDNGSLSTMRTLTAIIVIVVLFNWTYANIKSGNLVGFSWEEVGLIIGPLLAKAYQKDKEKPAVIGKVEGAE